MLDGVKPRVEDTIRNFSLIWDENQGTVLSLLQQAMAKIAKRPHLEATIASTINELDKMRRMDPERIRIAVSGTSGEAAIEAVNKGMWARFLNRSTRPVSDSMASEIPNQTRRFTRFKQKFPRFRAPQSTLSEHSANVSVTDGPAFPSGTSEEHPDGPIASSSFEVENLAVAVGPASLAKGLEVEAGNSEPQGSVSATEEEMSSANTDSPSEGHGNGQRTKDKGDVKLTREALYNRVLSTSLYPVISRVKTGAQSCLTESLNEMADLAHRAVCGALEECYAVTEEYMEAQKSKDTEKLRADTLECLSCWGNLVAVQGAIQEMNRLIEKPVIRLTQSRPPSSLLLSPTSTRSQSPSPSSFLSPT